MGYFGAKIRHMTIEISSRGRDDLKAGGKKESKEKRREKYQEG